MRTEKIVPVLALFFGGVASFVGLFLVAAYSWSAVISRWGDADQSLLFWYLPFLFVGIGCVALGSVAGAWAIRHLRSEGRRNQ